MHGLAAPSTANLLSIGALAFGMALVTRLAVRRHLGAFEIGAAATAIFMLSNKVYSPVYDLWLVPFFAALPIARKWWITFCSADLGIYFVVYGDTRLGLPGAMVRVLVCGFVLVRAVTIVAVIAAAVRSKPESRAIVGTEPGSQRLEQIALPSPREPAGAASSRKE